MKNIQIISSSGNSNSIMKGNNIVQSTFDKPKSLDNFDIVVIDLSSPIVWRNHGNVYSSIDLRTEFIHLNRMINNSKNCSFIFIYPYDCMFMIDYRYYNNKRDFQAGTNLRNQLRAIEQNILMPAFDLPFLNLMYENTITCIDGREYESSFCILNDFDVYTKSDKSNKTTTIKFQDKWITTLKINNYDDLKIFLNKIGVLNEDTSEIL